MNADERRLETAILILRSEFDKAKINKTVKKPVSYAFYKAWRYVDAREKERENEENVRNVPLVFRGRKCPVRM